jgi:hypothetical protein
MGQPENKGCLEQQQPKGTTARHAGKDGQDEHICFGQNWKTGDLKRNGRRNMKKEIEVFTPGDKMWLIITGIIINLVGLTTITLIAIGNLRDNRNGYFLEPLQDIIIEAGLRFILEPHFHGLVLYITCAFNLMIAINVAKRIHKKKEE